jgi:hypothetical protein
VSPEEAGLYLDGERLGRVLELLAFAPIADPVWSEIRAELLAAWVRKDVGDGREQRRPAQVSPEEAEVDVRKM